MKITRISSALALLAASTVALSASGAKANLWNSGDLIGVGAQVSSTNVDTGYVYDFTSGKMLYQSTSIAQFESVAYNAYNNTLVLSPQSGGGIYSLSQNGNFSLLSNTSLELTSLETDSSGNIFGNAYGGFYAKFTSTGSVANLTNDGITAVSSSLSANEKTAYLATSSGVEVVNLATAAVSALPGIMGSQAAYAVYVMPNGDLLASNMNEIYQLNPTTGAVISSTNVSAYGSNFEIGLSNNGSSILSVSGSGQVVWNYAFITGTTLAGYSAGLNYNIVSFVGVNAPTALNQQSPSPAPEPSSAAVLLSGIALVLLARRARKRYSL